MKFRLFLSVTAREMFKVKSLLMSGTSVADYTLNELEIKLYRQSLVYYADQEYEKATDLLKFLIARTEYTRFEYIERLANIYHIMNEPVKEYQLLDTVLSVAELIALPAGLEKKLVRRLLRVKQQLSDQEK